jgi:methylmalonyl-CoA/ethylmalonyl-CoA epimerase
VTNDRQWSVVSGPLGTARAGPIERLSERGPAEALREKQSMSCNGLNMEAVCQIAIVVKDIEKAAKRYADVFGVAVPSVMETATADKTNIRYHGEPTAARAKLAFFKMGQISLELIEPIGGPSTWKEWLDGHGEGVHHIAFRIQGMDEVLGYLNSKGMPTAQRGDYTGGRYAYVDAAKVLGVNVELLENLAK